ncbi:MAG: branched-chain amino acid aminotransferase [Candidatus Heimdallarchaeota archaeon]|nr:MAG: branched-chain amino acid aminotransferase [Candidatus Heimdallarchaeota archaeon]
MKISYKNIPESELKPKYESEDDLGFGKIFTDRMFVMEYKNGVWENPVIRKYSPIDLDPSAIVLHYAQEIFEGQKAFSTPDGHINLFRPDRNAQRFNSSARRMMMPEIDPENYLFALKELIKLEKDWAPKSLGTSLYIRPTMIGTEPGLGVRPSTDYLFYVILSPSGPYFPEGFQCVKIFVSEFYIRAASGGTGNVKTGGNYAASLLVGSEAEQYGCSQVLWLDAIQKEYVEEVGASNIFFVFDDVIYTAPLSSGTILPGVTRDSTIQLAKDKGLNVEEEALSIKNVIKGIHNGKISEVFMSGTAASIAPVGSLYYQNKEHIINNFEIGDISRELYNQLTDIQYGRVEDPYDWIVKVI